LNAHPYVFELFCFTAVKTEPAATSGKDNVASTQTLGAIVGTT